MLVLILFLSEQNTLASDNMPASLLLLDKNKSQCCTSSQIVDSGQVYVTARIFLFGYGNIFKSSLKIQCLEADAPDHGSRSTAALDIPVQKRLSICPTFM